MATLYDNPFTGTGDTLVQSQTLATISKGSRFALVTNSCRILSNRAYRSADPTGEYITDEVFGTSSYTVTASMRQSTAESTNTFRIIGRYVDASNYYFLEYALASTDIKLWKRVSGSNTQIGSSYSWSPSTATIYAVALVINADQISVTLDGSTVIGPVTDTGVPATSSPNQIGFRLNSAGTNASTKDWQIDRILVTDFASSGGSPLIGPGGLA